jgi:hypothetical protein
MIIERLHEDRGFAVLTGGHVDHRGRREMYGIRLGNHL